jgi:Megaviricetes DNA primase
MNSSLRKIIHDVMITDADSNYTHHSFYGPQQRLRLKMTEYGNFWNQYCDLVSDHSDDCSNLSLGETTGETPPVLARFTLEFSGIDYNHDSASSVSFSPYGEDFIMSIVSCYQQAIVDNLELSETRTELICCVLEPEEDCVIGEKLIVTFNLQFPYCRTDAKFQKRVLMPTIIKYFRQMNVMKMLEEQPDNDWEKIVDSDVYTEPWPLYRGTTNPKRPPLSLTHIYGFITQEHIDSAKYEDGPELELAEVFVPTHHTNVRDNLVRPELFDSESLDHWLPMFLSLNYWSNIVHPKEGAVATIAPPQQISDMPTPIKSVNSYDDEMSDMDISIILVQMLGEDRRDKKHFWTDIGKALFKSSDGGVDGLDTWIDFTQGSEYFDEDDCRSTYPTFMGENKITVKTIAWYAKEDNPKLYTTWHRKWCLPALKIATSCQHADVAAAMYRIYWLEFACTSLKYKTWYQFENHRWKLLDKGHALRDKIRRDFLTRCETFRTSISQQIQTSSDVDFKANAEILMKKTTTLISKLKGYTFKNLLMNEAMDHFYAEFFNEYKDSNPNLMGIINGIVETEDEYATVRSGKPEDYVTMCSPVYYQDDMHWRHPKVAEFLYWMRQCFPDAELCAYFLRLLASCLKSGNYDKIFPIFTGDGNNSKSMVKKAIEGIFGSYSYTFPSTFVTQTRGKSSQASPELAMAKYAKIAWIQEPDESDSMMGGTIKELTGMDQTFARLLNENGGNFTVEFKLILMCNKIPSIPSADKAIKNRVSIVPFPSTWVDPEDPDNDIELPEEEEAQFKAGVFKIDPTFSDKIPSMTSAALWVLISTYAEYKKCGLKSPDYVTKATKEYWTENDMYQLFTEECISIAVKTGSITDDNPDGDRDGDAQLTLSDAFNEFKFWFKETYPGSKPVQRDAVKYELEQRWGRIPRGGWRGIKVKQQIANI